MNYWIITVKDPYCNDILRGFKTMEMRKSVPSSLRIGDVIFIARKGCHGEIVAACRVVSIISKPVSYFCSNWLSAHRLGVDALYDYAGYPQWLVGIGLKTMKLDTWCLTVRSFGYDKAPQWFYRINPAYYKSTIERVLNTK